MLWMGIWALNVLVSTIDIQVAVMKVQSEIPLTCFLVSEADKLLSKHWECMTNSLKSDALL